MSIRCVAAACAVLMALLVDLGVGVAAAQPGDDGQVIVVPGDHTGDVAPPSVDVGVIDPGSPGGTGTSGGRPGRPGQPGGPAAAPCTTDGVFTTCTGAIVNNGPGGVPLPTPGQLAGQAFDQLRLPLPVPRHSPDARLADGRSATVVGEHTWVWTEPTSWAPVSKRVQVGPVWAEVTATPKTMSFDSGMGSGVACTGPGTPYDRSFGLHAASPDCDFVYTRSSYGMPADQTTAAYVITWSVRWSGSTGGAGVGDTLPDMQSRATATFAVVEVQALRSG